MTKKKQALRCALAGLLSAALLTGCSSDLNEMMASMLQPVKAGQTISADSKWINSDIDGAILEDTQVELKDDFHTAVNKEWLLETTLDSKHNNITRFSLTTDVLNQRKLAMIKELQGDSQIPAYETSVEIDAGLLEHDGELVGKFAELAGNWEKRNALGVEPARAYIEAIETIDSMEQLDDYLLNRNGMNFTNINIIEIMIEKTFRGEAKYAVMISPTSHLSLGSQDQYTAIGNKGEVCKQMTDGQVSYLLGRMGYSTKEINSILKRCYRFEGRLAQCMKSELETSNYKTYTQEADNHYTLEELVQLSPVFPMQELIAEYGLEGQETYIVMEPDYVKGVQKLYSEKYLEEIKSYYIVQTVMQLLPLLDRESLDKYQEISKLMRVSENSDLPSPSPESEDTMLSEEEDLLLNFYFHNYLSGAFDQIYIARYCTREQKEDILDMIEQTIDVYREIILSEEWLSEEARQKTVEKLENMTEAERFAFWKSQLQKCIRCNACRNVCPACSCIKCVFDNPASGISAKANDSEFEEKLFHIIRAFHVAGRCTDCGECSRVCPQNIPLHLLNRKFIKDIDGLYGEYQAGETDEGKTPLTSYTESDKEPNEVVDGEAK